ncbi:MAG: ribulokinase [Planctomycetota bacterium]
MDTRHQFTIGIDYGTSSVRALVVDIADGREVACGEYAYREGEQGVVVDAGDPNIARQHPRDYIDGLIASVRNALSAAARDPIFTPAAVVGIGVDSTGSTPIPVDEAGEALALKEEFARDPDAMAWLWKDHTAHAEAEEITTHATERGEPFLAKCGGVYSSEWYWAKLLRYLRKRPDLAARTAGWVELCDFVPAWLTDRTDPSSCPRGVCAAGHKAMYHPSWGGLPADDFLDNLEPGLSRFRYTTNPVPSDHKAGGLAPAIADRLGLTPGIAVAVGAFDAHMGAVGAGAGPGTLVKIMGTSTCDCLATPMDRELPDIPGLCGIVPESILPGAYGLEAGQSAVGDIFNWFVSHLTPAEYGGTDAAHQKLSEAAAELSPGESGLVALDWNNGNRTVLVDPLLTGLLVGQTLQTTAAEVYRALVEGTAFGALTIINRFEDYGVVVSDVINCGGIAEKNPFVMQIYADVCDRPMRISRSAQTCALGAAVFASVAAGGHPSVEAAQAAMTGTKASVYVPDAGRAATYRELFRIYSQLHDAFGSTGDKPRTDLGTVMKDLIAVRQQARAARSPNGAADA